MGTAWGPGSRDTRAIKNGYQDVRYTLGMVLANQQAIQHRVYFFILSTHPSTNAPKMLDQFFAFS
jgi:hypothetical protein